MTPPDPTLPAGVEPAPHPGQTRQPSLLPPDPAAYDSERNVAARRRGLAAPYIPGGRDPDQDRAEREDRRDLRILLAMVVTIVLFGFVVGIVAALLGFDALAGRAR